LLLVTVNYIVVLLFQLKHCICNWR